MFIELPGEIECAPKRREPIAPGAHGPAALQGRTHIYM